MVLTSSLNLRTTFRSFTRLLAASELLGQHRVLDSGSQDGEEDGGQDGAQVESGPGDGVSQQHLPPLPVHRVDDLSSQDRGTHAVGHLLGND